MAEPVTTSVILTMVTNALIGALAGKLTDELWSNLKRDPAQDAFKQALGAAIQRYGSTGSRLELTRPLLQEDGPLTETIVANEVAKLVLFDQEPDAELIGERWKAASTNQPQHRDFTFETKQFLDYLRAELRATEVFGPVFDAESLDAIATETAISAESLANIEAQLTSMNDLLEARLVDLIHAFNSASASLRDHIIDYSGYIEEKTRGFAGRQWVFDQVNSFMQENPRGYFFIIGDPGIGKSALAAQTVKQNGYVHHFNIRAEGINKAATFLKNVCAQLIAAYDLKHIALPSETSDDAGFLKKILGEVSEKLKTGERCVIVVDALDEVDPLETPIGANLLYLPLAVPERIYFVVTMREDDERKIKPRVDCEQLELYIDHDSSDNLTDIRDFVRTSTARPGIITYITRHDIEVTNFVTLIVQKSEGNFMYLRHVLPEIERGAYKDFELDVIPIGLQRYYQDHWQRMGMMTRPTPNTKLKIIYLLCEIIRPASRQLIGDFAQETELIIQSVLDEWQQFLHEQYLENQTCYSVYHTSFRDFLHRKDIVQAAGVDISSIHRLITSNLWDELFEDE